MLPGLHVDTLAFKLSQTWITVNTTWDTGTRHHISFFPFS